MTLSVFITAGEASGDVLGARLMAALKVKMGGAVRFHGVGGPLMQAEGLKSLFPMEDLSVMGIAEVLPRLNLILKRIKQASDSILKISPDVVVTIDAPDFSFRVVKRARAALTAQQKRPHFVHYVAPTVWAWRPKRAQKVARLYDGIMCFLPFEPSYFEQEGLRAGFVGHPMLESGYDQANGAAFRARHNIPAEARVLGVLFGSRGGELRRMGADFVAVMRRLHENDPNLHFIAPTLPHLAARVQALVAGLPCVVESDVQQKWAAFAAMDGALATSGTVGLELAVANVPHVIAYKTSPLTAAVVRRMVNVKYAHLANLLLDQSVVPEFIQENCTAPALEEALTRLPAEAGLQKDAFATVRHLLAGEGEDTPSMQAAQFVLDSV